MAKKRDKLEIIFDILAAVKEKNEKIKQTHIMYKANLSSHSLQIYLSELLSKRFLEMHENKKNLRTYCITNEGLNFLRRYAEIKDFMNTFGIESGPESP